MSYSTQIHGVHPSYNRILARMACLNCLLLPHTHHQCLHVQRSPKKLFKIYSCTMQLALAVRRKTHIAI